LKTISGLASDHKNTGVPVLKFDDHTYQRSLDCVHCGLCLPACPTYTQNGLEADSPRGRIYLIKGLAEGSIEPTEAVTHHLDLCLDCQACEGACPSGVVYHELIEGARELLAPMRKLTLTDRLVQMMFLRIFTHPTRLKIALLPPRLLQKIGLWKLLTSPTLMRLLPKQLEKMQQMLPPTGPLWEQPLAERYPAFGKKKATVAFFPGCVGSVMFQHVNRLAVKLLQQAGCEVLVPKELSCCGAIHHHAGFADGARNFVRNNLDLLVPKQTGKPIVDYIVNTISGCGAALKHTGELMRNDTQYADRAKAFTSISRDITEVLAELLDGEPPHELDRTVTYHHACHLAHAQKVTEPPLQLLRSIKGLKIVALVEDDMCCGAAGTYNLTQPEMARDLAERKIKHIQETGTTVCITGNVGCAMQIQSEAKRMGINLVTKHPIELLHEAYFGNGEE
jgi:glycolate oxidase iron-sulfur subunit